ncbi:MAG: hypothetical protein QM770_13070 [Tepidisphaeraceae bacterium]
MRCLLAAVVAFSSLIVSAEADTQPATQPTASLPAFPGAEGFGMIATGGRGGEIVHVTTLDDAGPGSLREAVSQSNRVVVFDVAGIIRTKAQIAGQSNITLLGQTAPAGGITVYGPGLSFSGQTNVIVRYLRLRGSINNSRGSKQLNVSGGSKMIFDHLSISWGRWDNLGFTERCSDITLQDSIVGEAIDPQRFGALIDSSDRITVTRTLWLNNQNRNPKGKANMQYVNNVVYNWGGGGYGGGHSGAVWKQDLVNNVFVAGPSSKGAALGGFGKNDYVFSKGNLVDTDKNGELNGTEPGPNDYRKMTDGAGDLQLIDAIQNTAPAQTVLPAAEAFARVLERSGSSLYRDSHDLRMLEQVRSLGKSGAIINDEQAVGGIGELQTGEARKDSDHDGIPDVWETAHGLNAGDASDAALIDPATGYMNIERYASDLVK